MATPSASGDTAILLRDWANAKRYLEGIKRDEVRARSQLAIATAALAKNLCPEDAKAGENFCVWYGDSLFLAEVSSMHPHYEITVRQRGKTAMEMGV